MTKIVIFGDPDCTADTVKVLDAIFKFDANADLFVNEGDNGYNGKYKKSIALLEKYFPANSPQRKKLRIVLGNHDHEESEPAETEAAYGAFFPEQYKSPPEFDKTDQSWENTKWLVGEQVGDIYNFIMNSQDLDIVFKRNQYNWVVKQLGIAATLRKSGKIKWIIGHTHKPWFTLKSSHSPYTDVREIYTKLFENLVNQMWHGHNHNDQAWRSMIAIKVSGNASGKVIESLLADGKTIDHSKHHGWTTNINGHSGHEHNKFKEDAKANKNVMWANDSVFTYSVVESLPNGLLNTKWKDVAGKVLFEYNISIGATVSQPQTPSPTPDNSKPTSPPPGEGYKWDPKQKKWLPILEHPSFLKAKQQPTGTPPPPPSQPTGTPPPPPPPQQQPVAGGQVIWTSKGIWDNGKDRTFTSTDPDDPRSQMRAGENRSCHVDGKGTAYFSGARGRMYWYATNYDFIMQFDMVWNDTVENIGLRGRSRHNEGGDCDNAFGGYGANFHKAEMDFKSEDSHSAGGGIGSENFKYPKPFEAGKPYGIKFQLKSDPNPHMLFWIDYKDGKDFIKVGDYTDQKPLPCRINRKAFEEISYLWLRTNNEAGSPKDFAVSNMVIVETSGIKQSSNKGKDYAGGSGE
jgi:hypothetical protein